MKDKHIKNAKTADIWNIFTALALFSSPFVFQFTQSISLTNAYVVSMLAFILAAIRVSAPDRVAWVSWLNFTLGIWLIISPFALSFTFSTAVWTSVILGIFLSVLSVTSALETQKFANA